MTITVLLADDNAVIRKAIGDLLKGEPEIKVVAEAVSFTQAMDLATKLRPRIVILDLHMDDQRGVTPTQVRSCLVGSRSLANVYLE